MLPRNYAVLVVGDPRTGMFEFCCYLASRCLAAGERVVFVETNTDADHVRRQFRLFGADPVEYETLGRLSVTDFSSSGEGDVSDATSGEFSDLGNLEEVLERTEEGIVAVGGQPVKVIFDSLTPLYLRHDSSVVGTFFDALVSMAKMSGKLTATVHRDIVPEDQISMLSTVVDGVLEMRMDESFHRHVRIRHFRGLDVKPRWVRFDFEREEDSDATLLGWPRE
ncbi:MAG: RAD55 family ATPase [Thermoplasmata archaeon]